MPPDYYFGLTAASAESADSFEVYRFNLFTSRSITREEPHRAQQPPVGQPDHRDNAAPPPETQTPPTAPSDAQLDDLRNRLQTMAQSMDSLFQEVKQLADKSEGRHQELSRKIIAADRLNSMDQRLQGIEKTVREYQGQFSSLQNTLKDSHSSLVEGLPKHMSDSMYSLPLPSSRRLNTTKLIQEQSSRRKRPEWDSYFSSFWDVRSYSLAPMLSISDERPTDRRNTCKLW